MTIKQKFSSIDQSKLTADQKSFLDKIKNVTKNFTDAEMNKKVEQPLDNFIAKAKEKMPEAIKSAPAKSKAKTSQTRKPKRTAMSLAKEIRKEGESWKDAQARARKMMKEGSQEVSKTVETELDKLSKLVRSQKDKEKLVGISGTDIKRDAVRKAKPRGARRVTHSGQTSNQYGTFRNKLGRKYYESRDRHSDRLAPRYPKNAPLLAEGGYLTDPTFGNFQNQVFEEGGNIDAFTLRMVKSNGMQPAEVLKEDANVRYNRGGAVTNERKHVNKDEDYEVRYAKPRPSRKGYKGKRSFSRGGLLGQSAKVKFLSEEFASSDLIDELKSKLKIEKNNVEDKDVIAFAYTDYGGDILDKYAIEYFLENHPNNIVVEPTSYYGKNAFVFGKPAKEWMEETEDYPLGFEDFESYFYEKENEDFEEGINYFIKDLERDYSFNEDEVRDALLEQFSGYFSVSTSGLDYSEDVMIKYLKENDLIKEEYNRGGALTNERLHVNKAEDYEVRYAKPRPSRKGYKGVRNFSDGGLITETSNAIFNPNEKNGKIETLFGYKTKEGLLAMMTNVNYTPEEITNAIFISNAKKGRIYTEWGAKTKEGLLEMIKSMRNTFELGGVMATDLAGHTGGGDAGLNAGMPLDGFSNTGYTGLVGETGAMSSGEMFMAGGQVEEKYLQMSNLNEKNAKEFAEIFRKYNKSVEIKKQSNGLYNIYTSSISGDKKYELGGGLPSGAEQSYMITESFGNPAQHFAKGGGVRRVGNREYALGRNWTNDHRHINKGEDHEVKYNRKGKFLGVFNEGGAIKDKDGFNIYQKLDNKKNKDFWVWEYKSQRDVIEDKTDGEIFEDYTEKQIVDYLHSRRQRGYNYAFHIQGKKDDDFNFVSQSWQDAWDRYDNDDYAKGGGVRRVGNREYALGRNWTNDHRHVNKGEDHEVSYKRKKFMAGGINEETPKIYVADLEAYNNGRLVGEWLDLSDYNDADELMDAIQDVLKKSGGEEYAIHDAENIPSSMYSEYMGKRDFEELYEMMELADRNDLPLSVVSTVVSEYGSGAVDEFYGKYDSADEFAQQMVDDLGITSFIDFERYLYISETDRRLLAQEMADGYVEDIKDEDGGNRLIEEAGMDVSEYEEADSETQEEMLDKAREVVYDEYYDTWYDGLNDPYYFLVEEQGMYSPDDFANANFVQIDYEALAEALEYDYAFVYSDGDLYVFNIR